MPLQLLFARERSVMNLQSEDFNCGDGDDSNNNSDELKFRCIKSVLINGFEQLLTTFTV